MAWQSMWIVYLVGAALLALHKASAQEQSFRVEPSDTEVIQGQTAVLKCEIDNRKGDLQWFKNEFGMGYDRSLPGFPRYSVIGNEAQGEFNLMIQNVNLDDDADYHCQVLPVGTDNALMATGKLNVLIPPDTPVIEGHSNGSVVQVSWQQDALNLTCHSDNGKPAAEISWFRNGEAIEEGFQYSVTDNAENSKLQNAVSALSLQPRKEENGAVYQCQATNGALKDPLDTLVELSVMHPPNPPEIEGFTSNKIIKTGDTMKLMCISKGGNPLAQVYWYRNDVELDFSYESGNHQAQNELIFTVQPTDNEAVYRCEASNKVTADSPLTTEIKLKVLFAPKEVTITGHEYAKAGETVTLKCESGISNPAAVLTWFSGRDTLEGATSNTEASEEGGFVTTSEISVTLTGQQNEAIYECRATNDELQATEIATITVKVLYPPEAPTITGYTEGAAVTAGGVQVLTCTAVGGNPLATLTWHKGNEELKGVTRITGNIVSSQRSFLLEPDDNGATYSCNASNEATPEPLVATATFNVNFPPKSLKITTIPENPKAGENLKLECKSSTSNPSSVLSWWKDGEEISGIDGGMVDAEFFGKSTISSLELVPTVADDGEIYSCRATNPLLERSVNDAVVLNVLYKPVFPEDTPTSLDIIEHQSAVINFTAAGNPADIEYVWQTGGGDISETFFQVEQGLLNIVNITRKQSGDYECTASNSEGSTVLNVKIDVQYPAGIKSITKEVMVTQGENATLECVVDANPTPEDFVTFTRTGYDMSRVGVTLADNILRLSIVGVSKDDLGVFTCSANNGIGKEATAAAGLVVKFAPVIDQDAAFGKAAANTGNPATLICKADGAPGVTLSWLKGADQLDVSSSHYKVVADKTDLVRYESVLTVYNVSKADYGQYKCVAKNDLGEDSRLVSLIGTTRPDPPRELQFINATHNSITLAWKPGFWGGLRQTFQVRYNEMGEEGYKYEDVVPDDASVYTIKDLKLATEYIMTVRALNALGPSTFQEEAIKTRTSAVAPQSGDGPDDDVPLIIILTVTIIGMILLALNFLLILFFIRRRKKQREKEASEGASQANTLEMLSAPTITEDSKSYSGYDGRSLEDYPEYGPYDDDEEMRKFIGQQPPMFPPPYYSNDIMFSSPQKYPPGYYPSPMAPQHMAPSPGMDQQQGFPLGSGSREPLYMDEKLAPLPGWDPLSAGAPPPQRQMSSDSHDDYTDQLRKMTQNVSAPPRPSGSTGNLGPPGPPAPPTRSSSKGAVEKSNPPLPARNYGAEEVPRYGPPPAMTRLAPPIPLRLHEVVETCPHPTFADTSYDSGMSTQSSSV